MLIEIAKLSQLSACKSVDINAAVIGCGRTQLSGRGPRGPPARTRGWRWAPRAPGRRPAARGSSRLVCSETKYNNRTLGKFGRLTFGRPPCILGGCRGTAGPGRGGGRRWGTGSPWRRPRCPPLPRTRTRLESWWRTAPRRSRRVPPHTARPLSQPSIFIILQENVDKSHSQLPITIF